MGERLISDEFHEIEEFEHPISINSDQFRIKCIGYAKGRNRTLFSDTFYGFKNKKLHMREAFENDPSSYNVVILMLDGVYQHQFFRDMPRTLKFLKKYNAGLMGGFSAVRHFLSMSHTKHILG
jgi:hypothetical protein